MQDRFDGDALDLDVWVPYYLPHWSSRASSAATYTVAGGDLLLGEDTKFAGMFRAHGLLVPVWDVPGEPEGAEFEAPLADFAKRYQDTLAETGPLDGAARRAKQGLIGRQLTLR